MKPKNTHNITTPFGTSDRKESSHNILHTNNTLSDIGISAHMSSPAYYIVDDSTQNTHYICVYSLANIPINHITKQLHITTFLLTHSHTLPIYHAYEEIVCACALSIWPRTVCSGGTSKPIIRISLKQYWGRCWFGA